MRNIFVLMMGLALLLPTSFVIAQEKPKSETKDSADTLAAELKELRQNDQVVVFYLHMNRRCMTCNKLEAYSKEAIESGFAEQLKDSSVVFRIENFEQEGNEHFVKEYQLYSQSLILSRQHDGKETEWKNLDKIWKLVGNKEEFISYVQTEVANFIKPQVDE